MSRSSVHDEMPADELAMPNGSINLHGGFEGENILVPLLTVKVPVVTDQAKVALALSRISGGSLSVVNSISVPEQTPKSVVDQISNDDDEALLEWILNQSTESAIQVDGSLIFAQDKIRRILQTIRAENIDTLVLPSSSEGGVIRTGLIEKIALHADCDVVVVNGKAGYSDVPSILLPVAGGPNAGLTADVAQTIASDCDAWIDIFHVIEESANERKLSRAKSLVESVYRRIACPEWTSTWILEADDPAEAIIEQSRYYGLTIIGAPTKGRLRRFIYGSTNETIRADAKSVVLSVRNNSPDSGEPEQSIG